MIIHILSENVPQSFWRLLDKCKDHQLESHDGLTLAQVLKQMNPLDFLYWEVPQDESEMKKGLKLLSKREDLLWGILDPQGQVKDPADLFFNGACDYLGIPNFPETLGLPRFNRMIQWGTRGDDQEVLDSDSSPAPSPGFNLQQVVPGQEYSFFFLLVTISDVPGLKKRFGDKRFHQLVSDFQTWLGWSVQEEGGQIWMEMDTSFLILFPDHQSTTGIIYGFKTLLARLHLGFEYFRLERPLDLTLAAHRGTSAWQPPGKTGTVVSDAVNSIFHLGQKYAPVNTLSMTENCLAFVPETFKDMIIPVGSYEGREIFRFQKAQFNGVVNSD